MSVKSMPTQTKPSTLNLEGKSIFGNVLTGSNVQSVTEFKTHSETIYFDIKNKIPLKSTIYTLFDILSFVCNFNYSVQNSLITMMMITFLTPNIVDSLIWTIPNFISILIRPYLIRYVHKAHKNHKIRTQAFLVNLFLFIGAIGAFLISQSGLMNDSKKGFYALRILICSIGWTLTGMSFQLTQYFIQKLKQSIQQQCYIRNIISPNKQNQNTKNHQFVIVNFEQRDSSVGLTQNYKFLGSFLGYFVVLLLFLFPFKNIKRMPSFFQQASVAYLINGFLCLFGAIAFYFMISYSGIPKNDPQLKSKNVPFKVSSSPNYYLPGLSQLKGTSLKGLAFLAIHFMVVFIMDVMFIYTTMWTTGSNQTSNMKQSEANFYGINNGVFYLIIFTFIYYANLIPDFNGKSLIGFKLTLLLSAGLFIGCFWMLKSVMFLPLIILLGIFYKSYQDTVQPLLQQIQPQIKNTKQIVIRIQKIIVLNFMPFISMILLDRDDIVDCMLWCAAFLVSIALLLTFTNTNTQTTQTTTRQPKQQKAKKQ